METKEKKPNKLKKGCMVFLAIWAAMMVLGAIGSIFDDGEPAQPQPEKVEDYNDNSSFHQILAKNMLVSYLKENYLKDPDSYKEVEYTSEFNKEKQAYSVIVKYRAKNSFGATVTEKIYCDVRFEGKMIYYENLTQL